MWKDIWERKGKDIDYSSLTLSDLISIDGFDSSGKALDAENWIEYAKHVCMTINDVNNRKSILEIGCGAGAFLKAMESFLNKETNIYGIDYSQNLINIAKHIFLHCLLSHSGIILPPPHTPLGGGLSLSPLWSAHDRLS